MKIGIVTQQSTIGASMFEVILATVFEKTQSQKACIIANKNLSGMKKMCLYNASMQGKDSFAMYRAMLGGTTLDDNELFDYAYRLGKGEVFAVDCIEGCIKNTDDLEFFLNTIQRLKTPMVLVEVNGDPSSQYNTKILESVDAILVLFDVSVSGLDFIKNYKSLVPNHVFVKSAYVCMKYDRQAVPEKIIAKEVGVKERDILQFPYCTRLIKSGMDGTVDTLVESIVVGEASVLPLRQKMLDVMQHLYDNGKSKYIRGLDKWCK